MLMQENTKQKYFSLSEAKVVASTMMLMVPVWYGVP